MEERSAETNSNVDSSAPPSVAQLAGRFREQAAAAKEKSSPNASHPPKIKVKSSPLIEKLQANLTFDPTALLPGASPKSPGLKAMVSPFHSPPSTPSSPGVWFRPGEAEEVPVSFDQPPEGSHLPCYNKVRTRGSIKRRPPSRRFRRSQSDCGDLGDFRAAEPSQENGAREENGDEMFPTKSNSPGSSPASMEVMGEGARGTLGPAEKPSRTEKQEEKARTPEEAKHSDKAGQNPEDAGQRPAQEVPQEPPQTSSQKAENGCGSPVEEKAAGEETETGKSTEVMAEAMGNEEDRPGQKSQDEKKLELGTLGEETPHSHPTEMEDNNVPEQEKGTEKQEEGAGLEPGCSPGACHTLLETSSEIQSGHAVPTDDTPVEDTKM
ncbi:capZ-interacting protein isoform X2 [Castor canadensis]|uniref:CapZ-interacting protein n=2 Tax=Castor canadensis TaxID=51338 RepID=A0A8C0WQI1_CASCN